MNPEGLTSLVFQFYIFPGQRSTGVETGLPPTIVYLTLLLADAILYTSALGFLGIGIDPSTPEWGAMLSGGRDYLLVGQWWITVFPGLMILISVLSFNLFGDGLREALDPKMDL